ncbi:MAG: lyase, partial [Nannocystaceae bacterium]
TTDPTDPSTTDPSTTDPTDDPTDATTDDPSTTGEPCEPGDTDGMMGMVEKSFLWVANTDQGSIAKIDTLGVVELARYRSGPTNESGPSPSRTAVSADGRFVVVNNRATARITMIAANEEDCSDNDNNNTITTSQNPNDLLAWNTENDWADECIIWSTKLPAAFADSNAGPRAVTWNLGTWNYDTCSYEDPKIFVGYRPQPNIAEIAVLNSTTGAIEDTVVVDPWTAGDNSWGPYGAALDNEQNVWFTGLRGNLYKIDANDLSLQTWVPPGNAQFYGMTVDSQGRTWTGGCSGPVYRFDPEDESFTAVPDTNACHRGLAADREGHIWVASNGVCGIAQIDADTATLIQLHTLAPCTTPVGVSVDTEGFVWLVDQYEGAWKIDPLNPANKTFLPVENQHYTYSDMTGGQLRGLNPPQ